MLKVADATIAYGEYGEVEGEEWCGTSGIPRPEKCEMNSDNEASRTSTF